MEFQNPLDLIMDHSSPATCSNSLQKSGTLLITQVHLQNPCSNGQAKPAVKIIKGLLIQSKYAGEDPYLTLLAYRSTPVDSHLRSPGEMLYQCALCTTVSQRIKHQDPHAEAEHERLEDHAAQSAANHDHTGCHKKDPLYAGQTVSVLNNDMTLWLPATVDHICECHPDAVKPDMDPKVEVVEHPVSTPSAAAKQAVPTAAVKASTAPTAPPSVAPTTHP